MTRYVSDDEEGVEPDESDLDEAGRPPRRETTYTIRTTVADKRRAIEQAKKQGRTLQDVLRSFLHAFGLGEVPPGFPPPLPGEQKRAKKRSKKRK